MAQLESRRRLLIARCELQRAEMAVRVGELKNEPLARLLLGALGGARRLGAAPLQQPITWVVAIAGLLLLRRPRQILTLLGLARSAVSMAAKASVALQVFARLRSTLARRPRAGERA